MLLQKPRSLPRDNRLVVYAGEQVRVTGELETYKKKSVIKIMRPAQVKVMKTKPAEKKKAS